MEQIGIRLVLGFFVAMSLLSFLLMAIDKRRARKGDWRISERTLFLVAILGGALGGTLGMWCFRHKTRHWYFRLGFPFFAALHLALMGWLVLQ